MRNVLLTILISAVFACNSKKGDASSRIRNENPKKEVVKKLSAKEVVDGLEELGYFNLTAPSELEEVKADFQKTYADLEFFQGKTRGESLVFMDNRYYWVDCEELFEIGGLTEYLNQVHKTFKKLGLALEFGNEKSELNQNHWKHSIELNGNEYVAFEDQFSDLDWGIAYANFIEMLNAELRRQNSIEQFYPINCGNDGSFVLLTPHQLIFINQNYPIDDEHPTTMSSWKSRNGL